MSETQAFILALSFARFFAAGAAALLLLSFAKSFRTPLLGTWALAMLALTGSALFGALNFYLSVYSQLPPSDWLRLLTSSLHQFSFFVHLSLLVLGSLELLNDRVGIKRTSAWIVSAVATLLLVLPFSMDSGAVGTRWVLRIGGHFCAGAIGYFVVALLLRGLTKREKRSSAPQLAALVSGCLYTLIVLQFSALVLGYVNQNTWIANSLELLSTLVIASGMLFWLLEHERSRSERASADLAKLRHYDSTTGLANSALMHHLVEGAIARETGCGLMVVDLDHFRTIGDSLSRDHTDELFRELAGRLASALPAGAQLARIKHDTFGVLISSSDVEVLEQIAQDIRVALVPALIIGERQLFLTGSIGIAIEPTDAQTAEGLIHAAQLALHQCKAIGRGQARFYAPELNELADRKLARIAELRHALNENQFELYYQSIFDCATKMVGFEALLRWRHPQRGLLAPAEVIPFLADAGIELAVDLYVLRKAVEQIKDWRLRSGFDYTVAINISAASLNQPEFPSKVARILDDLSVAASAIELEITESMAMENLDQAIKVLGQLRELGVAVALDDFGTGFSSLSHMRLLPIQRIKIDRTFVRDVVFDRKDGAIVAALIELAHSLELEVTAEGVENVDQREFLDGQGVDLLQGYLLARPMSAAEIEPLLQNRGRKLSVIGKAREQGG